MTPITTDIADLISRVVTDDVLIDIANIVTDLDDADAMDRALPELRVRVEALVRTALETANRRIEELEAEAQFLCDRLRDLESDILDDEVGRQYYGHVSPARARLEDLLQPKEQQP